MSKLQYLQILCLLALLPAAAFAWEKDKPATPPAIPPNPNNLPKVLLIGDSISSGYHQSVAKALEGKAVVAKSSDNGESTAVGVIKIDGWLGDTKWDVIHFNWGVWDMYGWQYATDDRSPAAYAQRLETLVTRMKKTGARLIWATTTPVPPKPEATMLKRWKKEVVIDDALERQYQEAAMQVMKKHQVQVDDLYALLKPRRSEFQSDDNVHFSAGGSALMAKQVADCILKAIGGGRHIIPDDGGTPAKTNIRIDRHALVTRHNIAWNEVAGQIPVGNGEFCFNADGTGLQTFGGNSMSHWGWHSFPLPQGVKPEMVPATGTMMQGRVRGGDSIGTSGPLSRWMFDNPHIMNLGRIRLCRSNGLELAPSEITGLTRTLDLWSGAQTSVYQIDGEPVRVETCVHPSLDAVAVRIASPLIARGVLQVVVDFPYPALRNDAWVGDFKRADGHQTTMTRHGERRADFRRVADTTTYSASLGWSMGATLTAAHDSPHRFLLAAKDAGRLDFVCAFAPAVLPGELPAADNTFADTATHWQSFWSTGGAIDLSASKDPRWQELERRIVLSQYLMAAQSAGSWPPAETGLMGIDPWRSQFHMEMVWWHLAHDALWDRWDMADKALGCYKRFAPVARQLAAQLGYKGLKWPKSVGPEGRSAPWDGNQVLLWKQPHPVFLAELEYRLRPTRATLEKWADIINGTAENMADYPTKDEQSGLYSLKSVMPPSEQGITCDTVFDLAYWRWALNKAQEWRERMGLRREPRWDEVRNHLAPLPVVDGVFVHSAEWHDTYTKRAYEHPDPIGVFGMLPPTEGVDREIAHRTLKKTWETWNWNRTWGWDCPWLAMAAARVGEPRIAVEALLKDSARNQFDQRGVNTGGPCPYLPGNGGLLYAVAMMAAGWDGAPDGNAPGFPVDGSWVVKWEGLKKAP